MAQLITLRTQFIGADEITEKAPSGCYVSGLYLEGARWDTDSDCLAKSHPKVLIEELPILRVIPIEAHRLKLVVSTLIHLCTCSNVWALTILNSTCK